MASFALVLNGPVVPALGTLLGVLSNYILSEHMITRIYSLKVEKDATNHEG